MKKAFVPLWNPPEGGFAGGVVRARAFIERQAAFELLVVSSDSADIVDSRVRGVVRRLRFSWAYAPRGFAFTAMRLLNWFLHAVAMIREGLTARTAFDFVYVPTSEILPSAAAGYIVGRLRRIPVIFCNLNVRDVPLWALNRAMHRHADYVITLSESLARELRAEGISAPIGIGLVGVDDESVAKGPPAYDAIFVGRHTRAKGAFDAIEIWAACCKSDPTLKLAMVGPCNPEAAESLRALIAERNLSQNVALLGPVDEAEKWSLYARSRLCLFPSHVEGWGIVPIEAHLAGLPVVAYDLDAYEETIRNSPAAILEPVGDIGAMAEAVRRTLQTNDFDGDVARRWAQRFTWAGAVEREVSLIDSAIDPAVQHAAP